MPISALQHRGHVGTFLNHPRRHSKPEHVWAQHLRATRSVMPQDIGRFAEDVGELTRFHAGPPGTLVRARPSRTATVLRTLMLLSHVSPVDSAANLSNVGRARRHAVIVDRGTSTTPLPRRDDVKIEKLDVSCIESRQHLSFADMLRQVGRTFRNPIRELANEIQVIRYVNFHNRCPTSDETRRLASITTAVDQTLTILTGLIPGTQPLAVTQTIGGPLFEMMADSIDAKETNIDNLTEATEGFLALAQTIKKYSPKDAQGHVLTSQLIVPKAMSFERNKLSINMNGERFCLEHRGNQQFANHNGKYVEVSYSWKTREWFRVETKQKIQAFLSDGITTASLVPERERKGWKVYRRIDAETGQKYGEICVISKKGKIIPYRTIEDEIERFQQEQTPEVTACGAGFRIRRAPCVVSETPNPLGLLEQQGFSGNLYRADKRPPLEIIRDNGFGKSSQFYAVKKMTDRDNVLIVSESLQGALRYLKNDQGETYYVYEILPRGVHGVSLKHNIQANVDGAKKFFEVDREIGNDIDWGYETNGAIYLDEAHVYAEDVTVEKIKILGSTKSGHIKSQIDNLELGRWQDYL